MAYQALKVFFFRIKMKHKNIVYRTLVRLVGKNGAQMWKLTAENVRAQLVVEGNK